MTRPPLVRVLAVAAGVFSVLTIASGGMALFGSSTARAAYGSVVPFVLWFNFLSGFAICWPLMVCIQRGVGSARPYLINIQINTIKIQY